ncbi:hypothetical protein BV22DRAFT_532783 [Leucogyrophana mollusca]|uniref:Uncharacterized protein n=1 Tax=Leucogyrophana mollusca TaxID=85980 RepID=A0ACB8BES3_9AGAM|nr:hypothetical protein BV22DRAFT_532783 [Leucogyrophana mollusca]
MSGPCTGCLVVLPFLSGSLCQLESIFAATCLDIAPGVEGQGVGFCPDREAGCMGIIRGPRSAPSVNSSETAITDEGTLPTAHPSVSPRRAPQRRGIS